MGQGTVTKISPYTALVGPRIMHSNFDPDP